VRQERDQNEASRDELLHYADAWVRNAPNWPFRCSHVGCESNRTSTSVDTAPHIGAGHGTPPLGFLGAALASPGPCTLRRKIACWLGGSRRRSCTWSCTLSQIHHLTDASATYREAFKDVMAASRGSAPPMTELDGATGQALRCPNPFGT